jgi:ABC-2 type transport system permease protein
VTRRLFGQMIILLLLYVPLMTMRLFAEEKKLGTYELLLTSPVRIYEIVAGKYLASIILFAVMLVLTLEFPFFLFYFGTTDVGPTLTTYLGLFLIGATFLSVGLFWSAVTENQIIAAALTFGTLLVLYVRGWASPSAASWVQDVLSYISLGQHFDNLTKGVIDTRDIVYYLSLTIFMLRPFLISVHGHFGLTEAFPPLSVNSLALQDDRSRIENALF